MKGYWTVVNDNSKAGYHFHCERCKEDKSFIKGAILGCSCDNKEGHLELPDGVAPIKLPSCKKVSTGSCNDCKTPCCKEVKK